MEYIATSLLKPHPKNPRNIKESQLQILMKSIESNPDFFEARPIVASRQENGDLLVLGGHQRLLASKKLGLISVPVNILEGLTPEKEIEIMLFDNKSAGTTDKDKLYSLDPIILKKVGIKKPVKQKMVEVPTGATVKVHFTDEEIDLLGFTPTEADIKDWGGLLD